MLREPTIEKLHALRLRVLAATWLEQDKSPDTLTLPFDDRLALLVEAESLARDNTRLAKNLRDAKLRITDACIEGIEFQRERQLEKSVVRQLATCRWVSEHQTVLVTGATGTGKSYFACALAHQACRKGFRALYRRVPRLFDELRLARADGTYQRLLARLAKIDVLVLDDFAISPLTEESRRDLLEILEDRYALRATVITSQLKHERWHDYSQIPQSPMPSAIASSTALTRSRSKALLGAKSRAIPAAIDRRQPLRLRLDPHARKPQRRNRP